VSLPDASTQTARARTLVDLPSHVAPPFEVYLNGVLQQPGRDYEVKGFTLVFARPLRQEGRLGFWRWFSMFLGIAGTYRQNDVVDVIHELGGRREVASGLPYRTESP
jgi:hypothetical protein